MSKVLEDSTIEEVTSQRYQVIPQVLAATIVSWLSLVDGYGSAYYSPAEASMIQELNLTKHDASWICSLLPIGALTGSLVGGPTVEYCGRKTTLIITNVVYLTGWSITYLSFSNFPLYVSRFLNGYAVGVTSFALPVYLAETLQPAIRGRLGLFPTAFGNFGILICFILGNFFEWRELAGIGVFLTVPLLTVIWVLPESPRWCMSKGQTEKAEKALQWLRGKNCDIQEELEELQQLKKNIDKNSYTKANLRVLGIVLGLMFFQQFSGINAIIFYNTQIFEKSESTLDASICTAIIGVVNFISAFIAAILVDNLGRKILMYISSAIMAVMLAFLGLYFFLLKVKQIDLEIVDWLPLSCFILYVVGFSFGFGPIPWLMMGEILPAAIRGSAASIATAFNWGCTFIILKTFPFFVDSIGVHSVFWFFCTVIICSFVFLLVVVPETKNRSLEDIERILAGNETSDEA